jgi:CheY-like chemotaxis protein
MANDAPAMNPRVVTAWRRCVTLLPGHGSGRSIHSCGSLERSAASCPPRVCGVRHAAALTGSPIGRRTAGSPARAGGSLDPEHGARFDAALNDAFAQIRNRHPAVVRRDYEMPDLTGIAVLKRPRATPEFVAVP